MPRPDPPEFRRRAVALVRAGNPITTAAVELAWARKRIRQLEEEVAILKTASKLLGEDQPSPKGFPR